jgi:enamine deaminase RidA (YjgF/YER057c/UK114 family)
MTIKRFETGKRMSSAVVHNDTIYLAGVVADKTKGQGVREQTAEVLAEIERLLAVAGSDKTKILSAQIFLADISTFADMNAAWDPWVAKEHAPARATVEAKLAAPEYKVEIKVIAAKG